MPATLSLAMIVRNEEMLLERALSCARAVCDELIVVDTGSTDGTVEIAKQLGAKVFHFTWIDDFSAARNASFEHCTGDWILVLDADDVIPPVSQQKILEIKRGSLTDEIDVVVATYDYRFDETGRCITSYARERFIRNHSGVKWQAAVHEHVVYAPTRARTALEIVIEHRPDESQRPEKRERNRRILETSLAVEGESAQMLFYRAIMLFDRHEWSEARTAFQFFLEKYPTEYFPYDAMIRLSFCASELGNEEESLQWARLALDIDARRAEAYMRIGFYYYSRAEWDAAIPRFLKASACERPIHSFLLDRDYTWAPWDYLSVCYGQIGQYHHAIECGLKALKFGVDKERIKKNILTFLDLL